MTPSLPSSSSSAEPTVVSASILDVLAVFHDALAGVRFPDVDAAVLEADVRAVNDAAAAVAALEASLMRSCIVPPRPSLTPASLRSATTP